METYGEVNAVQHCYLAAAYSTPLQDVAVKVETEESVL